MKMQVEWSTAFLPFSFQIEIKPSFITYITCVNSLAWFVLTFCFSTILATLYTSTQKSKTSTKTTKKDEHKKQPKKADDTSKTAKEVKHNVSKEIPKRISPQKPLLIKEVAGKPISEVKKSSSKYSITQ